MSAPGSQGEGGVVAMTPEVLSALEGLRDLQLVGTPASTWVLGAGTIAFVLVAAFLAWSWWRQPHRAALRRLGRLHGKSRTGLPSGSAGRSAVEGVNRILRSEALRTSRNEPMPRGLSGDAWLRWLDDRAPPTDRGAFSTGVGRLLAEVPFAPQEAKVDAAELAALFLLAARWLGNVGRSEGGSTGGES